MQFIIAYKSKFFFSLMRLMTKLYFLDFNLKVSLQCLNFMPWLKKL